MYQKKEIILQKQKILQGVEMLFCSWSWTLYFSVWQYVRSWNILEKNHSMLKGLSSVILCQELSNPFSVQRHTFKPHRAVKHLDPALGSLKTHGAS